LGRFRGESALVTLFVTDRRRSPTTLTTVLRQRWGVPEPVDENTQNAIGVTDMNKSTEPHNNAPRATIDDLHYVLEDVTVELAALKMTMREHLREANAPDPTNDIPLWVNQPTSTTDDLRLKSDESLEPADPLEKILRAVLHVPKAILHLSETTSHSLAASSF
jgi:hypothetical protein